jgi:hypothetical protein
MVNAGSDYYRRIDAAQHGFVFSGFGVMDAPLLFLLFFYCGENGFASYTLL